MTELSTFGGNSDFVTAVSGCGVRQLVVGGLGVHYHCPERVVDDLDLLIEPTVSAGLALIQVLPQFNEQPTFSAEQLTHPKAQLRLKRHLYVDVITPHAEDDFEGIWSRAERASLNGRAINVAALSDLLNMKRRAFRERGDPKDQHDVQLLEAVAA